MTLLPLLLNSYRNYSPAIYNSDESNYTYELDLPGYEKKNVTVRIQENELFVEAHRKDRYGRKIYFTDSVYLNDWADTDNVKAELKDGVLKVIVPRAEKPKGKIIEIT